MSDDNVIDFGEAKKRIEPKSTLSVIRSSERNGGKYCRHRDILVGEDFGDVECATCKVRLDAHAVLLQYAQEERNFVIEDIHIRNEHARLRKEVAELRAEEKRIKARVKRARETVSKGEARIFARGMAEKIEGGEP